MKAKKKVAQPQPTVSATPGTGDAGPTLAGLPIDAPGLNDLMQKLTIAAKQETDPAKFTGSMIALLSGLPNRE